MSELAALEAARCIGRAWIARTRGWLRTLALLAGIAPAAHALPGLTLEWSAPLECPSAVWVETRSAELLEPSAVRAHDVVARAELVKHGDVYEMVLRITGPGVSAERRLVGRSCAELGEAAALLIVLAIDPELRLPEPPPTLEERELPPPEPVPAPPVPASPAPAPTAPPRPSPPRAPVAAPPAVRSSASAPVSRYWLAVGSNAGVYDDGLPGPAFGLGLRLAIGVEGLSTALSAVEQLERSVALASATRSAPANSAVDLRTRRLALELCYAWGHALRVAPCAGITGLLSTGAASNVRLATEGEVFWGQAGAWVALEVPMWEVLAVGIDAGGHAAVTPRPRFEIAEFGGVAEGRTVSAFARLALSARFRL